MGTFLVVLFGIVLLVAGGWSFSKAIIHYINIKKAGDAAKTEVRLETLRGASEIAGRQAEIAANPVSDEEVERRLRNGTF